jgi:hypothetical protein
VVGTRADSRERQDAVPPKPRIHGRTRALACALLAPSFLLACTSLTTVPDLPPAAASEPLALAATYDGDPRFLPLDVVAVATPDAPFHYDYEVGYERDDLPALLALFDPLTLAGFPVGKTHVTAVGTLEARNGGQVVKRYTATSTVTQTRTLYSSDSQTALRTRALGAVRDSIAAQIRADAGALRGLADAHRAASSASRGAGALE